MKKSIKTLLLTLLLGINLLNTGIADYSTATMEYTNKYDIQINSYDTEEYDRPITNI